MESFEAWFSRASCYDLVVGSCFVCNMHLKLRPYNTPNSSIGVYLHVWFHGNDGNCWLLQLRQAKTEIVAASKVAYRFLLGVTSNVRSDPESPSNSNRGGSPRFQASWLKNLVTNGAKPSGSSEIQNQDENEKLRKMQEDGKSMQIRSPSSHHSWGLVGVFWAQSIGVCILCCVLYTSTKWKRQFFINSICIKCKFFFFFCWFLVQL